MSTYQNNNSNYNFYHELKCLIKGRHFSEVKKSRDIDKIINEMKEMKFLRRSNLFNNQIYIKRRKLIMPRQSMYSYVRTTMVNMILLSD